MSLTLKSVILKPVFGIGIFLALSGPAQAAGLTLTGVLVFSGDSTGLLGWGGWNTVCNPGVAQMSVAGFSTCPLAVDISTPQLYTFNYQAGSVPERWVNLELFFNGETLLPGIHLINDLSMPGYPITAASTTTQQCLFYNTFNPSCAPAPIGPSLAEYSSGSLLVTPLAFTFNPDGSGQFQLSVTSESEVVPEPGTISLLAVGLVALLTRVRRRRQ